MARTKLILFESMESKVGRNGEVYYLYSGQWLSRRAIENKRKKWLISGKKNQAERSRRAAEKYRSSEAVRIAQARYREKRRDENLPLFLLANKKHEANRKGLDFNLTLDWYVSHWSQGCEMTGRDFDVPVFGIGRQKRLAWTAEIDRIDPQKGYTMDNCRLVCAIFNRAKMQYTDSEVFELANMLVKGCE